MSPTTVTVAEGATAIYRVTPSLKHTLPPRAAVATVTHTVSGYTASTSPS